MKLNFKWADDGSYYQYCISCHAEAISRTYEDCKTFYFCNKCKQTKERSIVLDPAVNWWVAEDGEYWHESAGTFIRNREDKYLFFERLIFPFAYTVPAGHVDTGEDPLQSAKREVMEEVGIKSDALVSLGSDDIVGDSCRRGSDAHRWHSYKLVLDNSPKITIREEGEKPVWLTLDEALMKDIVYPVKYVINKYYNELIK